MGTLRLWDWQRLIIPRGWRSWKNQKKEGGRNAMRLVVCSWGWMYSDPLGGVLIDTRRIRKYEKFIEERIREDLDTLWESADWGEISREEWEADFAVYGPLPEDEEILGYLTDEQREMLDREGWCYL